MPNKINTQTWTILIILTLATLTLVACSGPIMDDRQMVITAKEYLSKQNIREAALELRNALQKNPDNAEARYLLGHINLDIGDSGGAEKEFRRARKAGWAEEEAQIGLARALLNGNKHQNLLDEVEIKETYPPTARANLYGLRAAAYTSLGELGQATEMLVAGAKIDANALQLLKSTIQLRLVSEDLEGASSTLKQALSVHPDNPELLLLSATTALRGKDKTGAMEAYREVIDHEPPKLVTVYGWKARLGLAGLEIFHQNLDQAESTLAPIVGMYANDPTNYLTGMLAFAQGDYDRAEERLLKVLKAMPEDSQTHLLFGIVSFAQGDYEQAAYFIAKYLNAVPENLGARKLLGRTYIILGQQDQAQAILQPALDEESGDATLLALVGLSRLKGGDTASGIEGLEQALKVAPENVALRGELARAYISIGDTDRALEELKAILAEGGEEDQTKTLLVTAYLRAGNLDQAINTVLEMLARNPEDPVVLTLAGNVFTASDDKPVARKYFNKALQIRSGFVPASLSLAGLEEQEDNYAAAAALYKGIIDSDPESIVPMLALARLAEKQGKTQEMLDWLEQARERAPRDIKPRVMLAEYYLRKQQTEKADLLVKEAVKVGSQQPTLLALQGRVLMADHRYNEALPILAELVMRAPDSVFGRVLLGETYLKLGQTMDARKQLELALEKQPNYMLALVLMVKVELQSGYFEQALKYARQIQNIQPDLSLGYELAGDAWVAEKKYAEANTAYAQAWEREQSSVLAIKLSDTAMRSGKPDDALKSLLAWLNEHPDDVQTRQLLGTTYQNLGQDDKAIDVYERLLAVQPDNVLALNNLAWLYSLANDPKALGLAERAYLAYPDNAGIQDTFGWILVQQGQVDKGRRLLKQAMEKLSEVPEVRYHYAVALLKSGEKTEARKLLTQLLHSERPFEGRDNIQALLGE